MHIFIQIIYIYNHEDNGFFWLSLQSSQCGNTWTQADNSWLHVAGTNKPKSAQEANQGVLYNQS